VERPEEVRFDSAHFDCLRNLAFFANFTDNEVWETVGISQWQNRKAGNTSCAKARSASSLFVMIDGEARVTKSDVELTRMHAGSCFGEIAYLDEAKHLRLPP